MGHHYVPQYYLKGFTDLNEPNLIWMYDKQSREFTHASIKKVVQEAGYYSEQVEKQLSLDIEKPAHMSLDRLRSGEKINANDRSHLTRYIGAMLMRVPHRRRKAYEMLPGFIDDITRNLIDQITQWAETSNPDQELVSRRINEIENGKNKFLKDPPDEIVNQIRTPLPKEKILSLISKMTWRIIRPESDVLFITSDNPAFFFEAYGLGNLESELTFPLASDLALVANWQGPFYGTIYRKVTDSIAKELNRRVASGAERFVFFHQREDWVAQISNKQKPYLSKIKW